MRNELVIRNLQRRRRIDTRLLRRMTKQLLESELGVVDYQVGLHLVGLRKITHLNERFLAHEGPTDIITFDYSAESEESVLAGELFICTDVAARQAEEFRSTWQSELARYVIHGVLHLLGDDDTSPDKRRKMKRKENRLLRKIEATFPLDSLNSSR